MIIDLILDRYEAERYQDEHGQPQRFYSLYTGETREDVYSPDAFAEAVKRYEQHDDEQPITAAINAKSESLVKAALCDYIIGEYNPAICGFIYSMNWLTAGRVRDCFGRDLPVPAI